MPKFIYTAKSHPTKTISGYIEAESEQDAINKLTQSGCFPISLKPEEASLDRRGSLRFRSISKKEVAMFTSQLFNLVESGVNIINTLNIIYNQAANKYLKNVLGSIVDKIKDGKSLSESLAAFPHIFSNLYSAMISVGEASGNLKSVLKQLSAYLEEDEEFKSSLRASLVYPLFIFSVGALTVFILLVFVIPRLVAMFDDMGQVLPLPTRIIISVSTFLRNYWWLLFAIVAVGVFLLKRAYSHPQGKLYWDRFKLKIIILGSVILKAQTSRLMRTLSLLISSGIPITPALDISASILENEILKSEVKRVKEDITSGLSLSHSLKSSKFFPEAVGNIVAVGEETGDLEKSLSRIASDYEKEISTFLKTVTRLIEPVIILVMGLVVGFLVLSMLLPIFQINLSVK